MAHTYFLMKHPDEPERVLVWDTRTLSVGRSPENAVVLREVDVSRKHSIFVKNGDHCEVGDHQTGNGTFINGERVTGTVMLKDGDVVAIGKLEMHFQERDEHPAKLGLKLEHASHLMTAGAMPTNLNPNATMVGITDSVPGEEDSFVIEHNDGTGSDLFGDDLLELDQVSPPPAPVRDLDFELVDDVDAPPPPSKPAAAASSDANESSQSGPVERMRRLKSLHAEGLITDEEFKSKRAEILEGV